MKLIYLDFDGVLNTIGHWKSLDEAVDKNAINPRLFDPYKLELLNKIVELSGADVVISSMWRHWNPLPDIARALFDAGARFRIVGQTPILNDRGLDIATHLSEIRALGISPNYVILDDVDVGPDFGERFLRTDPRRGLTPQHVRRAVAILGV